MSDISGQDIHPHGDEPSRAIAEVRNWLATASSGSVCQAARKSPGYDHFNRDLAESCAESGAHLIRPAGGRYLLLAPESDPRVVALTHQPAGRRNELPQRREIEARRSMTDAGAEQTHRPAPARRIAVTAHRVEQCAATIVES